MAGVDYLAEAVSVLQAAQQVCTRESDPDTWAKIRDNLAVALANQGVRCGGEAGVALLDEAIGIYRELLQVFTRDADLPRWANVQTNLSFTLTERSNLIRGADAAECLH